MTSVRPEILNSVNEMLNKKFEIPLEKLKPEAHLKNDLNLDSLDFVDMFIIFEQKSGKSVQNIDFLKIQTLGDIYNLANELIPESKN